MHHKNFKNSTANHNNPQHHKPPYPSAPAPQSGQKRSVLSRIRERFQEKPATPEEVRQLGLNAKREVYKTQIQRAKSSRSSRFSGLGGGGPSYRRGSSRAPPQTGSWLLDSGNSKGGFMDTSDSGPSLDFITGGNSKARGRKQESGFGKGLTDMF